jgi:hypothetical protein
MAKSWTEKYNTKSKPEIKRIDKSFADIPENGLMLIATPQIIAEYINQIPKGKKVNLQTLRKDLAIEHRAEYTCPVTTGIFLRIIAEKSFEEYQLTKSIESITPFWRIIEPKSKLASKLSFGIDFLTQQIENES